MEVFADAERGEIQRQARALFERFLRQRRLARRHERWSNPDRQADEGEKRHEEWTPLAHSLSRLLLLELLLFFEDELADYRPNGVGSDRSGLRESRIRHGRSRRAGSRASGHAKHLARGVQPRTSG